MAQARGSQAERLWRSEANELIQASRAKSKDRVGECTTILLSEEIGAASVIAMVVGRERQLRVEQMNGDDR